MRRRLSARATMNERELQAANLAALMVITRRKIKGREKASEAVKRLLWDLGIEVDRLWTNRGYWSHSQQDCYRWEFTGRKLSSGLSMTGGSYSSMKDVQKANRLQWVSKESDGELSA